MINLLYSDILKVERIKNSLRNEISEAWHCVHIKKFSLASGVVEDSWSLLFASHLSRFVFRLGCVKEPRPLTVV